MTSPTSVLIASLSGRALASSARCAGILPLVVDAFGDEDTRAAALDTRVLAGVFKHGFRARTLLPALRELANAAPSPPVGLVLGSGFEDKPTLVGTLARNFNLLGCSSETVRACKDPFRFQDAVKKHKALTPPVAKTVPDTTTSKWLRKHIGGTGGAHITYAAPDDQLAPNTYGQGYVDGQTVSMLCLTNAKQGSCHIVGFSEQWCAPTSAQPFRYGGAVGPIELPDNLTQIMATSAEKLSQEFRLQGLVAMDFIIADGAKPYLIEINPRPSATLDIFETRNGDLFKAHIAVCLENPTQVPIVPDKSKTTRAAGYLYADRGGITVSNIAWPSWCADRPSAGTQIPQYAPVATIFAKADFPEAGKSLFQTRLGQLSDMIYDNKKTEAQPK